MDSKTSLDQLGVSMKISCKSINKSDDNIVHLSSSPSMVDNGGLAFSPITPDSNKELSELMSCFTSPLTSCRNENDDDNPLTMKYIGLSRSYAARMLNFNSVKTQHDCEKPLEDDMLLEAVYDSLLECIITDILGEISAVDSSPDALRTPRFAPRLTGIAEGSRREWSLDIYQVEIYRDPDVNGL
ncbi:hypothetical protein L1987_03661 [Smallanthus sonchifolius]|uniref:Uncharacterized protein n=1 Tax=Smallanthus sonchifolius TaxID=185202 RepID=A0ACB9KBI2_9ASTR|nr:hypothetical protein L1987_03661 [Smallanthus sonchifolius]